MGISERRILEGVRRKMIEIVSGRDNVGGTENEKRLFVITRRGFGTWKIQVVVGRDRDGMRSGVETRLICKEKKR